MRKVYIFGMIMGGILAFGITEFFNIEEGFLREIVLGASFLIGIVISLGISVISGKNKIRTVMLVTLGGGLGILISMSLVILFNIEGYWRQSIMFLFSFIGVEIPFDIAEKNNEKSSINNH